jgi:hypothetical protein
MARGIGVFGKQNLARFGIDHDLRRGWRVTTDLWT